MSTGGGGVLDGGDFSVGEPGGVSDMARKRSGNANE